MKNNKRLTRKITATILILVLDFILIAYSFSQNTEVKDVTYDAKKVEKEYYERDFVSMMERIEEQQFYGEDMKVYKEAMDAYILKMRCELYTKAGDDKAYEAAFEKLNYLAENCETENQKLFSEFVSQVNR